MAPRLTSRLLGLGRPMLMLLLALLLFGAIDHMPSAADGDAGQQIEQSYAETDDPAGEHTTPISLSPDWIGHAVTRPTAVFRPQLYREPLLGALLRPPIH